MGRRRYSDSLGYKPSDHDCEGATHVIMSVKVMQYVRNHRSSFGRIARSSQDMHLCKIAPQPKSDPLAAKSLLHYEPIHLHHDYPLQPHLHRCALGRKPRKKKRNQNQNLSCLLSAKKRVHSPPNAASSYCVCVSRHVFVTDRRFAILVAAKVKVVINIMGIVVAPE